jgi:sulfite reductase (NADPH) flavoprotein alpha-component
MEFIEWFGLDPDASVSFPSNSAPERRLETRTVFQVLQQNLDLFGRPGKSFYEVLSRLATDRDEARTLRFIGSAEGSSTFKKWAEVDTVTYADVLRAFPSTKAALGLEGLVREVESLKPRHYSIASSQNAVGDSVHLLVVTVDWETKKGAPRHHRTRAISR